jgi:hypothetical protein
VVTDLFPDEERQHPKLGVAGEGVGKRKLSNMMSVAGEWGETHEYDETAKAGIENV